jgi:hypothetical protein
VEKVAKVVTCERLVTSGYLASDQPELSAYSRLRRLDDEGWAADLWERTSE